MARSIEFKASLRVKGELASDISQAVQDAKEKLRKSPDVERVEAIVIPQYANQKGKMGGGFSVVVTGTIFFKADAKPDLKRLIKDGEASFGPTFLPLPAFPVNTSDPRATTFAVFCQMCGVEIGTVKNSKSEGHYRKQDKRQVVLDHTKTAHPGLDPNKLVI